MGLGSDSGSRDRFRLSASVLNFTAGLISSASPSPFVSATATTSYSPFRTLVENEPSLSTGASPRVRTDMTKSGPADSDRVPACWNNTVPVPSGPLCHCALPLTGTASKTESLVK